MNKKPTILLLGSTGQLGKLIAQQLQHQPSIVLRVTSRKDSEIPKLAEQYGQAVFLDLDDPKSFERALHGVDRLFLLTGYSVSMLTQSKTIIDAAKKAHVNHIVHLGIFSTQWDCTVPHFVWHQLIEVYIKASGLKWTFLHPNCFLQNLLSFSLIKNGKFRWYTAKTPCGWIALEDVAEAAAKILIDGPTSHHAKDYWFSTESLSLDEMSNILTEVTGKAFLSDPQPSDQFIKDLGIDPKTVDPYFYSVAECCRQIEDGRMADISKVKDDIPMLLGHPGMTVRQWMEKHREELIALANQTTDSSMNWGAKTK